MLRRTGERPPAGVEAPARTGGRQPLRLSLCATVAALAGLMLLPAAASAAFHLMKIREVHTGGRAAAAT